MPKACLLPLFPDMSWIQVSISPRLVPTEVFPRLAAPRRPYHHEFATLRIQLTALFFGPLFVEQYGNQWRNRHDDQFFLRFLCFLFLEKDLEHSRRLLILNAATTSGAERCPANGFVMTYLAFCCTFRIALWPAAWPHAWPTCTVSRIIKGCSLIIFWPTSDL